MICPVVLGAVGLIVVAPELFQLFLPQNYVKVILPFQIFTLISVHRVTEYGLVLRAANRSDLVTQSSIVLLVSNVAFAAIGLKIHGLSGMACGSLLAFGVAWLWMLRKLSKIFCVSVRDVFPWRTWLLTLLVASVVGYAAELLTSDMGSPLVSLVMKLGAVWGIGFLLINHSSSRRFIKR
jgi:O-antigen/teichoic acid export membrane protein